MPIRSLILVFAFAAQAFGAHAQVTITPSQESIISLEASRSGLTRIAFENDRAASVQKIGEGDPEGDFSATKDPATGDLYVVVGAEARPHLSFFVSTEKGQTYQVMMAVRDVPTLQVKVAAPVETDLPEEPGPVDLQPAPTSLAVAKETGVADLASLLIRAMYSGARIDGFETRRFRRLDWLTEPLAAQGFSQRGVIEWAGNGASGYAITVRNETTAPTRINFGRLAVFNVVAATGDQSDIARRKTAQIFLVVKGGR